ncbi:hypothetical protein GCM10007977_033810 [Dactylosporangium sucinum]|uniref:Uncharacterized protein n=2 Tax=Dactylosporangium sucinum TaxID=1424081 RepID=A0A917TP72_9ACTN|nr:hypothetical protein GCM10007977_033810 [Dactylosporangium sucinum]
MHTLDELRRALADEAAGRTTRTTFDDVRRAVRRRRLRAVSGGLAALLAGAVAAGSAAALTAGGPSPSPAPATGSASVGGTVSLEPFESLPPAGPAVHTGVRFGTEEELVLWYQDDINGVLAGVRHTATGKVRRLDGAAGVPQAGRFGMTLELDDRNGGIVDYGVFGAAGAAVRVTADGTTTSATTAPVPGVAGATLFWARRTGAAVGPTGVPGGGPADLAISAVDGRGRVIATGDRPRRSDGAILQHDSATQIGARIGTGLASPTLGELVFWFQGDEHSAVLYAGCVDAAGTVTPLRALVTLQRPPFDIGFYGGFHTFDLGDGGVVSVGQYAGAAATVEMRGTAGAAARHGSGAWSAHPRLRVFWAVGIPGRPLGFAYDGAGTQLGTTDFTRPGGG